MKDATSLPSASSFEFSKLVKSYIARRFLNWTSQGIFYIILLHGKSAVCKIVLIFRIRSDIEDK